MRLTGPTPLDRVNAALKNADFHLSEYGRTTAVEIDIVHDALGELRNAVHALAEQVAVLTVAHNATQRQDGSEVTR